MKQMNGVEITNCSLRISSSGNAAAAAGKKRPMQSAPAFLAPNPVLQEEVPTKKLKKTL